MNVSAAEIPGDALKLPISPRVGEMSAEPTEGGVVPPTFHRFSAAASDVGPHSTLPPSALPCISPTRGEIGGCNVFAIGNETPADVAARDALLERAMGPRWRRKSSEKLRRGRLPAAGLALVARDGSGRVVGTVRLWEVVADSHLISPLWREMSPKATEGGAAPSTFMAGSEEGRRSTLPPSALPGISPTRGEIGSVAVPFLLLGPLAVDPAFKSSGIGSALMHHAIAEATRLGHGAILLVGDASYYARFGFSAAQTARLAMPGPYEPHRFLALELREGALDGATGVLRASGRKVRAPKVAKAA